MQLVSAAFHCWQTNSLHGILLPQTHDARWCWHHDQEPTLKVQHQTAGKVLRQFVTYKQSAAHQQQQHHLDYLQRDQQSLHDWILSQVMTASAAVSAAAAAAAAAVVAAVEHAVPAVPVAAVCCFWIWTVAEPPSSLCLNPQGSGKLHEHLIVKTTKTCPSPPTHVQAQGKSNIYTIWLCFFLQLSVAHVPIEWRAFVSHALTSQYLHFSAPELPLQEGRQLISKTLQSWPCLKSHTAQI